jgi:O-antigen ligase
MTPATPFPRHFVSANSFQKVGFFLLIVYLFVMYSRLFDVMLSSFEIPFIVTSLVLTASLFSGGVQRAIQSPIGKRLLFFTLWMAICVPFSIWRGGSLQVLQSWAKAALSFVYVAGLLDSHRQCVRAMYTIGLAVVVLAIISLRLGNMETGRLFLAQGKFQNPNDLANTLLLGLPFIWLALKNSTQNILFKIPATIVAILVLFTMTKTGSRGAWVGFLVVMLFVFFSASGRDRIAIAFAAILVMLIGALLLPSGLRNRYLTLFEADEDSAMAESAITSSQARSDLLKRSVTLTLAHPLFGVGPGMFSEANQIDLGAQGIHAADLVSHNSYTTVSSELGFPGVFFYAALIWMSLSLTNKVYKLARHRNSKYWGSVANTAVSLRMSLVVYAVTASFASVSYQTILPTLAGFTVALYLTTARDLATEDMYRFASANKAAHPTQQSVTDRRFTKAGWQRT